MDEKHPQSEVPSNENQSADTEKPQEEPQLPQNTVTIEDAGPCKKKVTVEVPPETIHKTTEQQYKDLMKDAIVPGFRKGRAPKRLLEKRFGKEASEQIKLKLIADTSAAAIKDNNLKTLFEPDMTKEQIDKIELPEEGPMKFDFEVEVRPDFALPPLEGIAITQHQSENTDKQVEEQIAQMRKWVGVWTPRQSGIVESEDQVIADVVIKTEGADEEKLDNIEIFISNGYVGKIYVENLDQLLVGAKVEQIKETTVDVPKTNVEEKYRGKKVEIKITIKDVKELKPAELNEDFFHHAGVTDLADLQQKVRTRLEKQLKNKIKEDSAQQIYEYLDSNINFELPLDVVAEQAQTVLKRQYINLLMKGFQKEQIEQQIEQLKASSEEQAKKQLKTFFIMDKIAETFAIEVAEEEINGEIAKLAIQEGQRPEKLRHQMEHDGALTEFRLQLRQDKCITKLLEKAKITITEEKPAEQPKKTAKKSKKTSKKAADTKDEPEEKES